MTDEVGAPEGCEALAPLLMGLLDGELPLAERLEVLRHLRACPACRTRLEQMRGTRDLLARTRTAITAPPALYQRIERNLNRADRQAGRTRLPRRTLYAAAAACVVG